jgi:hypothetical protein
MTLQSFRKYHPEWEMRLYTNDSCHDKKPWESSEHKQDFFNYGGKDYFDQIKSLGVKVISWDCSDEVRNMPPSHKSNLFKWEIMKTIGGVYSDMDILYLRNIEDLFNDFIEKKADVGMSHNSNTFSIGFLMSSGNNEVFEAIYETAIKKYMPNTYQGAGVMPMYTRWKGYNELEKDFPKKNFYDIHMDLFYKLGYQSPEKLYSLDCFDQLKESFGLHWYAGGKESQQFNNSVNEENYNERNSTVAKTLNQILHDGK